MVTFTAIVSGSANTKVTWSVNGVAGGSGSAGTITAQGVYTAPADMPSAAAVTVTASSVASPATSASAQLTLTSSIAVGISPGNASVELGARQRFSASLSGGGQADTAVRWSVSGSSCPSACGTIDGSGNYTAPGILPNPSTVSIVAQSVADPSKQTSATVTITSRFTLQLASPASVATAATALLTATLTPAGGSNPNSQLNWSLSGSGCSGTACGGLAPASTQANPPTNDEPSSDQESTTYTAPAAAPTPNAVTITVTSLADPSKKASATLSIRAEIAVSLSPSSATVTANHRVTISVSVSGNSSSVVGGAEGSSINWTVNGISGGNSSVGQICAMNSSPCSRLTSSSATQVDYLAPGAVPLPNPVSVTATSAADSSKSASAQIAIVNHDVVAVLPGSVTLAPGATQKFAASVLGTSNQNVVWQLQGAGCGGAGACGAIAPDGTYTAPGTAPSPSTLRIVAISSDDSTQSGFASVTITSAAHIQALHPASVYAGGANGFLLRVEGGGFLSSEPGPGSVVLLNGAQRTTNCTAASACTVAIFSADVAEPGSLSAQMQNPDSSRSNAVTLIVVAPNVSDESIAITDSTLAATGKDIVVVEPTTAGTSMPGDSVDLNIAALGIFSIGTNDCALTGNPVVLQRPSSGTATADICVFSEAGLDASMAYSVSGPGDVSVAAKLPAGLGIIHLTLQIPAIAQPGARTLFIQNANLDRTAASGVLQIQ
jgi:hypothetical protein